MKRSDMIRYLEGLLSSVDGERLNYRDKAKYILSKMEEMGVRPPLTKDTFKASSPLELVAHYQQNWEEENLKEIKKM